MRVTTFIPYVCEATNSLFLVSETNQITAVKITISTLIKARN